ncbi:MAG: DNA methyltransferase [Chitinophagaceae bacterium]
MSNLDSLRNDFKAIDWNFSSFSNEGLNSVHWYPATFISAIPGSIIPILSKKNDLVLDTYCGTSVTGYESIRLGRSYVGIDNNPIAILISKAKLLFPETNSLKNLFEDIFSNPFLLKRKIQRHPNEKILKQWYHEDTINELNNLLAIIREIENPTLRIPSQMIFSSILKKASSQSRHWGWVCDNVVPKEGEIIYKNAIEIYNKTLSAYCEFIDDTLSEMQQRNISINRKEIRSKWKINCGDTIKHMSELDQRSIDLILTSPPYYGVADYVKAQRLSFLWFHKEVMSVEGFSYEDFEVLRKIETGARSKRHSLSSFDDYIKYMKTYIEQCYRVLKKGSYLVLIMGDSKSRNQTIDVIDFYASQCGFKKEFNFQRQIRETKRRLMAKVKNEQIKVYVKQ